MSTQTSPVLLRAEGLTAGYGKMAILHDVTLEVRAGEMVSVIGPTGAGPSTAFKTIVGFLRPTRRRVRLHRPSITWPSGGARRPAPCREASSRWWRSGARS